MPDNIYPFRLLGFLVRGVFTAEPAVFAEFELFRFGSFVLCSRVISLLALGAGERNYISHCSILYLIYVYA